MNGIKNLRDIPAFLAGYEVDEAKLSISRLYKAERTIPFSFFFWKMENIIWYTTYDNFIHGLLSKLNMMEVSKTYIVFLNN